MAKKKAIRGAKRKLARKYFQGGGSAYALPTSAGATTNNLMGLGNPEVFERNLFQSEQALLQQQQMQKAQAEEQKQALKEQSNEEFQSAVQQNQSQAGTGLLKGLQTGLDVAKIGKGTADAAALARQSADVGQLLGNLNSYGRATSGLSNAGQALGQGFKAMGPAAGGAVLGLAGAGIKKLSDDQDNTTLNFGETSGTLMQGAGTGLGLAGTIGALAPALAIPGLGWAAAGIGAGIAGIKALKNRNQARDAQAKLDARNQAAEESASMARDIAFNQNFTRTGANMGFNVGNSMTNSYVPSQQMMYQTGGKVLPGGKMESIGNGAAKFIGQKHSEGGIMLDKNTEVEGGETMDQVAMKGNKKAQYIFSDYLKLGGETFAKRHERMVKNGASQADIQNLAKLQEAVASKSGEPERSPNKVMQEGGPANYYDEYNPYEFGLGEDWAKQGNSPFIDMEGILGKDQGLDETAFMRYYRDNYDNVAGMMDEGDYEGFYDDVYVPRVNEFFEKNPDQAYNWLQKMVESEGPNAQNFRDRLLDENGNMLPKDEALKEAKRLATDKKIGSFHMYLPNRIETPPMESVEPPSNEVPPKEDRDITVAPEKESPAETPEETADPRNLAFLGALPGLAGLAVPKFGQYPAARLAAPQAARGVNLGRVNLNAERAANEAANTAIRRGFANQASGPAGMAASLAANQQARNAGLNIANQEARANAGLMNSEAQMNAQIAAQNARNLQQANQFNARQLQERDINQYDQDLYNRKYIADTITGVAKDAMQYQQDERFARVMDDTGSYMRFLVENQMIPKALADKAAEKTEAKRGGYIKKSGKIRRKTKK